MNNNGFITLHRKIIEWEWYSDSKSIHLFIHLLLLANHTDKRWQGISIKRGQLVTGIKSLSKQLGISERSIRTRLDRFNQSGEIVSETTNKFTVVTIVKYEFYQSKKTKTTFKQQTNDHKQQYNKGNNTLLKSNKVIDGPF